MLFAPRNPRSPLKAEWRIFLPLMLLAAAVLGWLNGFGQPDRFIYDKLIQSTPRPANEQIVIIAIDKHSIDTLGRWPWNRAIHAQLLDKLSRSSVRAIGMDIIFSEPAATADSDVLLAQAMHRNGRVILPVLIEQHAGIPQSELPLPRLTSAARALGHVQFDFDTDGVLRSMHPYVTEGQTRWPQFALALHQVGTSPQTSTSTISDTASDPARKLIAFSGAPGHFRTVSYVDVLSGRIPPSYFDDKYVLIGAHATGIATMFPTPVTTTSQLMSGAEINANILADLLGQGSIHEAPFWLNVLFTIGFTCLALFACLYLSPFLALSSTLLLLAAICAATYVLFLAEYWLPPTAAVLMVILVYPLWSWRRLEATISYLGTELHHLNSNTSIALRRETAPAITQDADFLDRQIAAIQVAGDRWRDIHQFISDSLNNMPDATLVLSQSGELMMYNRTAERYLRHNRSDHHPLTLPDLFSRLEPLPRTGIINNRNWHTNLLHQAAGHATEIEVRDAQGREFLLKCTASRADDQTMLGWIITLIDITSLRAAERRREESLNFISHDLRVPQSSILALIQLQKNPATAFDMPEFLARIEKSVESTLHLAESFVHLAKAESLAYQLQESDFSSILAEAADTMWAYAHSRSVKVEVDADIEEHLWLNVDRALMIRAIGNLISNAIKFSDAGSTVHCHAEAAYGASGPCILCSIHDQGYGIPQEKLDLIFSPFLRTADQGQDGIGLGLAFVKMVIERHGGSIEVDSAVGEGSTFTIMLPCAIDEEQDKTTMENPKGNHA